MTLHRYQRNARGMRALLRGDTFEPMCLAAAERGRAAAIARSPVDSGEYSRSFEVEPHRGWDGRTGARLINTSRKALAVEFGTKRGGKPHAVLTSVIDVVEGRT